MIQLMHLAISKDALLGLLALVGIFGFAPATCLRVIAKAWPSDDPMRAAVVADLFTVPYPLRPLYVAEQLEAALFDGLPARWRRRIELSSGADRVVVQMTYEISLPNLDPAIVLSTGCIFRWDDTDFEVYGMDCSEIPAEWNPATATLSMVTSVRDRVSGTWVHHAPPLEVGDDYTIVVELQIGSLPERRHKAVLHLLPKRDADALDRTFGLG